MRQVDIRHLTHTRPAEAAARNGRQKSHLQLASTAQLLHLIRRRSGSSNSATTTTTTTGGGGGADSDACTGGGRRTPCWLPPPPSGSVPFTGGGGGGLTINASPPCHRRRPATPAHHSSPDLHRHLTHTESRKPIDIGADTAKIPRSGLLPPPHTGAFFMRCVAIRHDASAYMHGRITGSQRNA